MKILNIIGPSPDTALTDPALFKALRDAGTKFFLQGGHRLVLQAAWEKPTHSHREGFDEPAAVDVVDAPEPAA